MHRLKAAELAREVAANLISIEGRPEFLPSTDAQAAAWDAPGWLIQMMQHAAHAAELERDSYRSGNTELLGLWLKLLADDDIIAVQERMREILTGAGLLDANNAPDWAALEARSKPVRMTWAEAIDTYVTDEATRARLLALGDDASIDPAGAGKTGAAA